MKILFLQRLLLVFAAFAALPAAAQLLLNEVCSANQAVIADEDNDYEDFVEVVNAGDEPINLSEFYLTDDYNEPHKWRFPGDVIQPGETRLFFASGKYEPGQNNEDHWETVVYAGDTWKYFVGNSQPDWSWNQPGFDDTDWLSGVGGFGYGDGDDATIIPQCYSLYLRREFEITDASNIARCLLNIDYDDGFIAYLNGVEIARAFIGFPGEQTPFDALAGVHEAVMYQGGVPEYFYLDEALIDELLLSGDNLLCVQVHNNTYGSSDFTVIPFFSVGVTDNSFTYGPVPGWFESDANPVNHTSFSIAPSGETLYIFNENYVIIDELPVAQLQVNNSHARIPDGGDWCISMQPSPGSSNNSDNCFTAYVSTPQFFPEGGFYTAGQEIYLVQNEPDTYTTYTLDGNEPHEFSTLYVGPIVLDTTVVIRARSFSTQGLLGSHINTSIFFADENPTLPVVAVTLPPADLWDWNTGIYVSGPYANPGFPFYNSNFWMDWEKKGHVEYYDKFQNFGFELDAAVKIHGKWSRAYPQKSFRVLTKDEYGTSKIDYQLFYDKNITSTDAFNIRNAGIDWNSAHMRDLIMNKVALGTHMDTQNGRHCLMFLNGQYFGVFDLRERIDVDYLVENHPQLDREHLDILSFNGILHTGTTDDFFAMTNFITGNDMGNQANYEIAKNWLDIENICDYFIAQTYYSNNDWLGGSVNNIKYWRPNDRPGRWRYILWDTDFGLGFYNGASYDFFSLVMNPWAYNYHSDMMNSLVANDEFRHYYINRYADLINTIFKAEDFLQLGNDLRDTVFAEMPRHFEKWGIPNTNPYGWGSSLDMNGWNYNYQVMLNFITQRPAHARNHVQGYFGLPGQVDVTLNVQPEGAGHIHISTIIPDEYPWEGVYFNGVPVKITALPNPGFTFSHWLSDELILSPHYGIDTTLIISEDDVFTAYFSGEPVTASITIGEVNYHSDPSRDSDDWLELYNYGNEALDISAWTLKDGIDASRFELPVPTILQPGERLVICFDSTVFASRHAEVQNVLGNMNFTFDNSGELIRLYDRNDSLVVSLSYLDDSGWPEAADGMGRTLELRDPLGDLNDPANWFAGCIEGSPGQAFSPCGEQLVISEINYHSAEWLDAGDWLELRNIGDEAMDLTGWSLRDNDNTHCYELDFVLEPGANVVLAEDMALFAGMFPDVNNVQGPLGFALNNNGEAIRLFDDQDQVYSSVVYSNAMPWPLEADGLEYTLELLDPELPLNDAVNWFAGCSQGSPGEYFEPCVITALDEPAQAGITLFPNPTNDRLTVRLDRATPRTEIVLRDLSGREVLRQPAPGLVLVVMDLSALAGGLYLVEVWEGGRVGVERVVKR